MKKSIVKSILWRFVAPWHLFKVIQLQINRRKAERVFNDAQLKLYGQLLPGGFLHYGYFDNPNIEPFDISINDIYRAQKRYAERLLEKINISSGQILDIGCGMGAMCKMMKDLGHQPIALTPDKTQAGYIRQTYTEVPVIESRFEDMDADKYSGKFDVVMTSESLQYLKLDVSLPLIKKILKQTGRWIACDYFRAGESHEKSGHFYQPFLAQLKAHGIKVVSEEDVTPHILPTIAYVHSLAEKVGMPILDFVLGKLETKAPGVHYALEDALPTIQEKIKKNMDTVNPAVFGAQKRYMLLVMELV